jgi:outer membrane receptor protein involved in Fe transport
MNFITKWRSFGAAPLVLLTSLCVFGQQDMGYITGLVTDPTGAVIPGATVTVTELETGVRTTATTTDTGNYLAGPLKIGVYEVAVQKDGFKRAVTRGVQISAQDRRRVDLVLELGQVTESITTVASAPLLETESASVSHVVEQQAIQQLPLNSRNYQTLALLAAGTVPAIVTRDQAGGFNAHGQAAYENNFIIDGVDNNSYGFALEDRKAQVVIPSLDAVQEFKVETSNYSAEFGRTGGSVMNVSIKSGTNNLHGSLYEYLRNEIWDARDTFSYVDRDGDGRADPPPLRQNQFGVTLGGPIKRNKAFFFGSFEGLRLRQPQSFLETVPTADERKGIFSQVIHGPVRDPSTNAPFPNNVIPQSRMDPVTMRLADLWPLPNFTGSGARSNYVSSTPWKQSRDQVDVRVDHNFNENNKVFARVSITDTQNDRYPSLPLPARGGQGFEWNRFNNPARSAALSYTRILSPSMVNEARLGFSRLNVIATPFAEEWYGTQYGIKIPRPDVRITGLPQFTFGGRFGYTSLGESQSAPTQKISQNWQILENFTWIRASHTVKAGVDVRFTRADNFSAQSAPGVFNFNGRFTNVSFADFLIGWANTFTQTNLQYVDARFRSYMFYVQDDWKVTPRLTLNLGLRYELTTPMWDKRNRQNKLILDPGPSYGTLLYAKDGSMYDRALIKTDTNNWAPRVGLAWRVRERWTVRAGAGLFYGGIDRLGTGNRMMANWPFNVRKQLTSTPTQPALLVKNGVPADFLEPGAVMPSNLNLFYWPDNFPITQIAQWNFSLQRQLARDMVLKVAYVGSGTSYIRDNYDWNAPYIGPPATEVQRRAFPNINQIQYHSPMGHSSFHGLDVQLEKRYSRGHSFSLGYGWGHALSNVGEQFGPDVGFQDPWNWNNNRGTAGFDIRHKFVAGYIYEMPFGKGRRWANRPGALDLLVGGWQLSGLTTMRTGMVYNPTLPNPQTALGTVKVQQWRPDRIAKGTVPNPNPDRWFDPSAFVRPCDAAGCRLGNAGPNILTSGGAINTDLGLSKYFQLSERFRLQFRWESFNAFNTPAFGRPNGNLESPDVGKVRDTVSAPRVMQWALRLAF